MLYFYIGVHSFALASAFNDFKIAKLVLKFLATYGVNHNETCVRQLHKKATYYSRYLKVIDVTT